MPKYQPALTSVFQIVSVVVALGTVSTTNATTPTTIATTVEFRVDADSDVGSIILNEDLIEVDSRSEGADPWSLQMQTPRLNKPIRKNDVFCLRFQARSLVTTQGGDASLSVTMAKDEPFQTIQINNGYRTIQIPPRWHDFAICFRSSHAFTAGEVAASLHLAGSRQRIEMRDLALFEYGQATDDELPESKLYYDGDSASDAWRAEANQRISKHRMTDISVTVVDQDGGVVPNASVHVQQTRHSYAFGTFVGDTPTSRGTDADRFRRQSKKWFNRVTLPRYWADWGTESAEGRKQADAVARWGAESGFELKTHLLLYPQFLPGRVKALANKPDEFRREIELAMSDALRRTQGLNCHSWDAINELRDVTLVGDVLGKDYYARVFNLGNQAHPNAKWFINEYGIFTGGAKRQEFLQTYIEQIRSIQRDGGAIEGIGLQGHFAESLISMPEVWRILDTLDDFKLPIEITEFDVDTGDTETQAQFTEDFLTAVFAHPATTGFTTWGFWEGDMWRPRGAMLAKDWSIKPNGQVWERMIFDRWWTDERLSTDSTGTAALRVMKGKHDVQVEIGGTKIRKNVNVDGSTEVVLRVSI